MQRGIVICNMHAGTQLRLKGYLGEETVTIGFQKGVLCVINLTSRSLYTVGHTIGFLWLTHVQAKAGNGCKNHTVWSWFQVEIWYLPVLSVSKPSRGTITPCYSTSYFLFNSPLHIAISLHSTGRLWTNLSTHCCRSYLPQTATCSTVQPFLPPGPSGPSPPSGSIAVEYLPTVEQRDAYKVVEVEKLEAISASSQLPKDPTITRVEVEAVTTSLSSTASDVLC